MVLYMNRYTVRPGTLDAFVREINASGVEARFRAMPGNILWADEPSFEAHLHCETVDIWHEIKDRYVIAKDVRRYDIP